MQTSLQAPVQVSLIVAAAENGVIGRDGALPWRLSDDLRRFKALTMGHTIVMGRKTWESIGRALPGRRSVVVSRQRDYRTGVAGVELAHDLASALKIAEAAGEEEVFVVGGAGLYREALPLAGRLYLTRVHASVEGDTYFPAGAAELELAGWRLIESHRHQADARNEHPYSFEIYQRLPAS